MGDELTSISEVANRFCSPGALALTAGAGPMAPVRTAPSSLGFWERVSRVIGDVPKGRDRGHMFTDLAVFHRIKG